jgi:hypothetical protein
MKDLKDYIFNLNLEWFSIKWLFDIVICNIFQNYLSFENTSK